MATNFGSESNADKTLTLNDFPILLRVAYRARAQWRPLGRELGISEDDLDVIERDGGDTEARFSNMLTQWLKQRLQWHPTWRKLVEALQAETVGREDIADDIAQKYLIAVGPSTTQTSAMQKYIPFLKRLYRSKMPGCIHQFPPPPIDLYFDVSLIKAKGLENMSQVQDRLMLTFMGRIGEVLEKGTPVQLKDLFTLDQEGRKMILIEGLPGSGKTTLAWHICQEWEKGNLFSQFDLVIYVQLRDRTVQAAHSIADLFPRNDAIRDLVTEVKAQYGAGVLFVLDGWDELPGSLPEDSPVRQLTSPAFDCPLPDSAVIVTSRPEASTKLRKVASSRIEIIGFTAEKVQDYFTECLEGDTQKVKMVMEQVNVNPAIKASCSIPLNATIIVTLFVAMEYIPPTMTDVFTSLITYCLKRHCMGRTDIKVDSLLFLDRLPQTLQRSFDSLCALAFQMALVNQVMFSEEECNIYPEFATLSLLQAVENFVEAGSTVSYNFLHLSLQDFLAAHHLSKLPADMQFEIVCDLLIESHARLRGIFPFYAGITKLQKPGFERVFYAITMKYAEHCQQGQRNMQMLLESLHEVQDPKLYQLVAEILGSASLYFMFPSPEAYLSAGYLLPQLSHRHIELMCVDDHSMVGLAKGLTKGCVDRQTPMDHLSVSLKYIKNSQEIPHLLSSSCGITHLKISFITVPVEALTCIAEAMVTNTSIRSLEVSNEVSYILQPKCHPPGEASSALCKMLQRNETLETLRFNKFSVTEMVAGIADGLVCNTTLKELTLLGCVILDTNWRFFQENFVNKVPVNKTTSEALQVKISRYYSSRLGEGVDHLAKALRDNRVLHTLTLDNFTVMSNPEPLADALLVNTTLEKLDIRETGRSEELTEKLMDNGVLERLLSRAIEKTVSKFGTEKTGHALAARTRELRGQLSSEPSQTRNST